MKVLMINGVMTLTLLLTSSPLLAEDGKVLYEESCTRCHTTEVFTRKDRGVNSLEGLKSRVKQCTKAADAKWTDDELKTVVEYLDEYFYKF